MKLHFERDWLRNKIEFDDIEEPYVIGPTILGDNFMSDNTIIEYWIAGKIEHLQSLIDAADDTTSTLRWRAQIDVLKELENFLDGINE